MSGAAASTFGATSTTDEVLEGVDLTGRRVLVTGASAGLGVETARSLAAHGAEVLGVVRDPDKARAALQEAGAGDVRLYQADLASLDSVRAAADAIVADGCDRLDLLIGNAGIMACPRGTTADGFELQFGTNHLGHFVLVNRLAPLLLAGAPSRVVMVSSAGHRFGDVSLDDPDFETTPYDEWTAYGRAKTANVLFAVEAARRWAGDGITVNALMPGAIRTNLQRHVTDEELERMRAQMGGDGPAWKTAEQGAATSVLAAASPLLEGVTGRYFEDCQEAEPHRPGTRRGVAAYALDPEAATLLWQVSMDLLDL